MVMDKLRKMILSCCLLVTTSISYATVKLPTVLGSNMVLQRNEKVCLWGSAKANATVTIKPSWNNKATKTQADKNGKFEVKIPPMISGTSLEILVYDDNIFSILYKFQKVMVRKSLFTS